MTAILYNSWPLGYIVNNQTAHQGLASDLERAGQPYYWLFILGDVLTGLSVVAVCALIRLRLWPKTHSKTWTTLLIGLLMFGLFTAIGTLIPPKCPVTSILECGSDNGLGLGLDGLLTGIAVGGLIASLISAILLGIRHKMNIALTRATQAILLALCTGGLLFLVSTTTGGKASLLQQLFIVFSGLALVAIGLNIEAVLSHTPAEP